LQSSDTNCECSVNECNVCAEVPPPGWDEQHLYMPITNPMDTLLRVHVSAGVNSIGAMQRMSPSTPILAYSCHRNFRSPGIHPRHLASPSSSCIFGSPSSCDVEQTWKAFLGVEGSSRVQTLNLFLMLSALSSVRPWLRPSKRFSIVSSGQSKNKVKNGSSPVCTAAAHSTRTASLSSR